jgi:dihydrofolate reductase
MTISLVVAASENDVIGKDNKLLWHLPNDMAFFKNTTWGMPVIMGRKTYDSMKTPLKGRTNIVITRNNGFHPAAGVLVADSKDEALRLAEETDAKEAFVIGGGEIFNMYINDAARIYITRVHTSLDGDAFFPKIDKDRFRLADELKFDKDERHAFAYSFQTWLRKTHGI